MRKMKLRGIALFVVALIAGSTCLNAESYPDAVILQETGFPSSDSSVPSASMLSAVLPGAQMVSAAELPAAISKADCTLMVLPYGSAFPEDSWPQILAYLNRGGNLLVLGGRPFTRAAYRDSSRLASARLQREIHSRAGHRQLHHRAWIRGTSVPAQQRTGGQASAVRMEPRLQCLRENYTRHL
jgi:hypothetical protein